MRVTILTQYFPPETGAPQNRLFAIARGLQDRGAKVTVITGMPNYPEMRVQEGYRGRFFVKEQVDGIQVLRCWLYVPQSKRTLLRLLNYFTFVKTSFLFGLFRSPKADVLITESPPLFLGISGVLLARLKGAKHVFNVSDLWPESAVQLDIVTSKTMISAATKLEMWCYRNSQLITGQTQGIVDDITSRCRQKRVVWIPNGADLAATEKVIQRDEILEEYGLDRTKVTFVYAGVLGHAQGLEVILDAAKILQKENSNVQFALIGSGPEEEMLSARIQQEAIGNVKMLGRLSRVEALQILRSCAGAVVPLRKNDLFKGAIPSKIFEALAMQKPILLGVDGEARQLFVNEGKCATYFEPENASELANGAGRYERDPDLSKEHGSNGSAYVRAQFDRERINDKLWSELQQLIAS